MSFVLPSTKYIVKIKKLYQLEALRLKNIYSPQYLSLPSPFKYPLPMPSLLLVGGESRTVERITIPCTLQLTKLLRSSGLHQCGGVSTSFHLKASSERSCPHFTNFFRSASFAQSARWAGAANFQKTCGNGFLNRLNSKRTRFDYWRLPKFLNLDELECNFATEHTKNNMFLGKKWDVSVVCNAHIAK